MFADRRPRACLMTARFVSGKALAADFANLLPAADALRLTVIMDSSC